MLEYAAVYWSPSWRGRKGVWAEEQHKQRHGGTKVHTQSMVGLAGSALRQWQMVCGKVGKVKGMEGLEWGLVTWGFIMWMLTECLPRAGRVLGAQDGSLDKKDKDTDSFQVL